MISERTKVLLDAAAALRGRGFLTEEAVAEAYALLAAIEQREKQNAPTSTPLPCRHERRDAENCPWCRENL